jgi:Fur family peroxide stress response transcriptional regulator
MRPTTELTRRLREAGLKLTSQRLLIYRYLEGNRAHPTAEQVYDEVRRTLPGISLTTVYKILHELVELGEVGRLDLGDGAARFDPNTERHIHARCRLCGTILDLTPDLAPVSLPVEADGFRVRDYHLLLDGECAACRAELSAVSSQSSGDGGHELRSSSSPDR